MDGQELTFEELQSLFEGIIEDSLDEALELQIFNDAKNEIEGSKPWFILQSCDSASTANSGDTMAIARTLPSDFGGHAEIYLGDNPKPLDLIPKKLKDQYASVEGYCYIDEIAGKYYLTGTQSQTKTIHFNYCSITPKISSTAVWKFPGRFHALIAYLAAAKFYNIDFSDVSVQAQSDAMWLRNAGALKKAMQEWDDSFAFESVNNAISRSNRARDPGFCGH